VSSGVDDQGAHVTVDGGESSIRYCHSHSATGCALDRIRGERDQRAQCDGKVGVVRRSIAEGVKQIRLVGDRDRLYPAL
jgi:hypothetical protein